MDSVSVLNKIQETLPKKISNDYRTKAVTALKNLFDETQNTKLLADYLLDFDYSVCQAFFEKYADTMSEETALAVAEALTNNVPSNKENSINILGFVTTLILAQKGKFRSAFLVLSYVIRRAEKQGNFSDGCKKIFKKHIADKSGQPAIELLHKKAQDGEFGDQKNDTERLTRFLSSINSDAISASAGEKKRRSRTANTQSNATTVDSFFKTPQGILSKLDQLISDHAYLDRLSSSLVSKESELASAKVELSEKDKRIDSLEEELEKRNISIREADAQISDLTKRLTASFQMDERTNNQELTKLKNNISEGLKLEYSDFMKSRLDEYSPGMFEAYKAILAKIFRLLRRNGIHCE